MLRVVCATELFEFSCERPETLDKIPSHKSQQSQCEDVNRFNIGLKINFIYKSTHKLVNKMNLGGGVIKINKWAFLLVCFIVVFLIYVFTSNTSIEAFPKRQQNKVSYI